uniref:Protein kinase domain-containing protein n=1 Tax=Romanomermis culicivorax TaxID=13658 RepID=A0A915KRY2_ROMCU
MLHQVRSTPCTRWLGAVNERSCSSSSSAAVSATSEYFSCSTPPPLTPTPGDVTDKKKRDERTTTKDKPDSEEDEEEIEVEDDDDYVDTLDENSPCHCFDQTFDYSVDEDPSNYAQYSKDPRRRNWSIQTDGGNDDDENSSVEITIPLKKVADKLTNGNGNGHNVCESVRVVLKRKPEPDVNRYDRICTLGVGTFGRVTLVRLKNTVQYYALKSMNIRHIVENEQEDHVNSERKILEMIDHPFITKLYWAYKDKKFLYMLFDYMPGGELFSYLRSNGYFANETARFYAAEILLALEHLHSKSIVYRDLKPENLLLDAQGHLVLIDFGFAKVLRDRTWTICGTAEYLAPEIIESKGHNKAVDFWAFGILIYEMLIGRPPFRAETQYDTYQKILECKLKFPKRFYANAKDLIKKLLVVDRTQRLGNLKGSAQDVKDHVWFKRINFDDLLNKRIK